jgi:soluble lytic murein transglycosylase-like protein
LYLEHGRRFDVSPLLIASVVAVESAGNPYAIRPEPGFLRRYATGIAALVKSTTSARDDHWVMYPDLFSCSYGLGQILYPVALELGATPDFPTELCDPYLNVRLTAQKLRQCLQRAQGDTTGALSYYNGDRSGAYATRVALWSAALARQGGWPTSP